MFRNGYNKVITVLFTHTSPYYKSNNYTQNFYTMSAGIASKVQYSDENEAGAGTERLIV